jgi:hypothetical protein
MYSYSSVRFIIHSRTQISLAECHGNFSSGPVYRQFGGCPARHGAFWRVTTTEVYPAPTYDMSTFPQSQPKNPPAQNLFGALRVTLRHQQTTPYNNDRSTADTIRLMGEIAKESANHGWIQALVGDILGGCRQPEHAARLLYGWVKGHVRFTEDEAILASQWGYGPDKELLIRPEVLVSMPAPQGDCDDFSILLATLVLAADLGIGVDFVTVAADSQEPDRFSHVYLRLTLPSDGYTMYADASHGHYLGWETDNQYRKAIWPLVAMQPGKDTSMLTAKGLGGWEDAFSGSGEGVDLVSGNSQMTIGYGNVFDTSSAVKSSPSLLDQIITAAAGTGLQIAKAQYGTVPGTYMYNAKTGTYYNVVGQTGQNTLSTTGSDVLASLSSGGMNSLLVYGLLAVGLVLVMKR